MMDTVIPLLAAFGLGTIASAIIQSISSKKSQERERRYKEKLEAFTGILDAIHNARTKANDDTTRSFAYWQTRCGLAASKEVRSTLKAIARIGNLKEAHNMIQVHLYKAMRKDLGIK